jgi:restriction endonuclease S subunit
MSRDGFTRGSFGDLLAQRDEQLPNDGTHPLYSLTIKDGVTPKTERYEREFLVTNKESKKYKVIRTGDLVFNPSNLRWGAIATSFIQFPVLASPIYEVFYPKDTQVLDPYFLGALASSPMLMAKYLSLVEGTLVERTALKKDDFLNIEVEIPPLPEQKKIAEILSGIDKEISRHQEKIEALRFLKKSTADALIHQEKFSLKPLQEVIGKGGSIQDGDWIESKDQDQNGNIRLVQLADIQEGHFMQKSSRFMNQEKANALNVTLLREGDLLVARMPDPIGRSCIFPGSTQDCVTVVDIAILRSNECNMKWLMHTINTSAVRNQIEELATGTTRKRISRGRLSELCIPYPEKTEQEYIAEQISSIDTALATLQNCIEKTKLLRSAISSELLSGRKRVTV